MRWTRTPWISLVLAGLTSLVGCERDRDGIFEELHDPDPLVRADAARRMGDSRAPECVEPLIAVLHDPDERVRISVVRALGQIGEPRALPALARSAGDQAPAVRRAVCHVLGTIRDPRAVPTLTRMIGDPDETVRLKATKALAQIPTEESRDVLLSLALKSESEVVTAQAIGGLAPLGDPVVVLRIEKALAAENAAVRSNAARALGELGARASIPALIRSLDDPATPVRCWSAHALFALGPDDPDVREALAARLSSEHHPMAQVHVAWNVARTGDAAGLEVLRTLLVNGGSEVRAEAAQALGEVGDASDVPRLERAVNEDDALVRESASTALQKLKKA